jgi:ABC-type glycerol-3-phosphate transport system substrate-binding protein
MMRRLLAIGGAVALGLSAMAASADEVTGTISNIDLNRNTFMLEGKTFTASPHNTVGVKLSELAEGDKVTVEAGTQDIQSGKQPINVMSLKKAE